MTDILIVEDDEFKAADVEKFAVENLNDPVVFRALSVTSALRIITRQSFDVVILDMSLPTFEISGPGGGGSPQGQGGLEVLRLAKRLKIQSRFIIITQYPDIELQGKDIPLSTAAKNIRNLFNLNVISCLLYDFEDDGWKSELLDCFRKLEINWVMK